MYVPHDPIAVVGHIQKSYLADQIRQRRIMKNDCAFSKYKYTHFTEKEFEQEVTRW